MLRIKSRKLNLLLAFLVVLISAYLFIPSEEIKVKADIPKVGEISKRTILSPITFNLKKSSTNLERERNLARDRVLAIFDYDLEITENTIARFDSVISNIAQYRELQKKIISGNDKDGVMSYEAQKLFQELSMILSTTAIKELARNQKAREELRSEFHKMMYSGISDVFIGSSERQIKLFKQRNQQELAPSLLYTKPSLTIIKNGKTSIQDASLLLSKENAVDRIFPSLQLKFPNKQALQSAFYELLYGFAQANIIYLADHTEKERKNAAESINTNKGKVIKGMDIINKGDIVSPDAIEKILALERTIALGKTESSINLSALARNIILFFIVIFFAAFYYSYGGIKRREPDLNQVWAIVVIIFMQLALFFLIHKFGIMIQNISNDSLMNNIESRWLYPFLLAPMLSTMLLGLRPGMMVTIFTATYMGVFLDFDLTASMSSFSVSVITIYFLKDIQSRKEFTTSALVALVAFVVSFFVETMLRNQLTLEYINPNLIASSGMIVVSVAIVITFFAHILEKFFNLTTKLTLIELADFNSKLLKDFSSNAPASFHHSIMVSNLAEKAAQNINANASLIRAMALYHDIGKTVHPQNFTENQKGANVHNSLKPKESVAIIKSHVSDGLLIAKANGIPKVVRAGIAEHHGDGLVSFFYGEAKKKNPNANIDIKDFCYDGPKPQSKETAILMMADAIEASSRNIDKSDSNELLKLVQNVIKNKLYENQLNESELKISDLSKIEKGFLNALEGMYHTRIKYPKNLFR